MKKKKNLIIIAFLCFISLIGMSIAYFNSTAILDNIFTAGTYKTITHEEFISPQNWVPGEVTPKTITTKNEGTMPVRVRVKFESSWTSKNGESISTSFFPEGASSSTSAAVIQFTSADDWVYDDEYYYYLDELAPGEETTSLIESITFNELTPSSVVCEKTADGLKEVCESSGDGYDDATFILYITTETVQSDKYREVWGIDEIRSKYAMFNTGISTNKKLKKIANNMEGTFEYNTPNTTVTAFKKSSVEPDSTIKNEDHLVSNQVSNYPIYAWFDNGTIYWWSECEDVYFHNNSIAFLAYFTELVDISGLEDINASDIVKSRQFFIYDSKITDFSAITNWDTSNFNSIYGMFAYCEGLTTTSYFSNWDTSNVDSLYMAFCHCINLTSLTGLNNWDTSNVTDMRYLFYQDYKINSLSGLENWDVRNVKTLNYFIGSNDNYKMTIPSLVPLRNWETSSLTDLTGSFSYLKLLTSYDGLENWDVSKVTSLEYTFYHNYEVTDISQLANWDVSKVKSMKYTFFYMECLTNLEPLANWNTESLTNLNYTFSIGRGGHKRNNDIIDYSPLHDWDVSKVTTMDVTFQNTNVLSFEAFEDWDVSNVISFYITFDSTAQATVTSLHGLENWNVSNATNMAYMFSGQEAITDASAINNWDVRNVTDFYYMFNLAHDHPNFTMVTGTWNNKGTFTRTS